MKTIYTYWVSFLMLLTALPSSAQTITALRPNGVSRPVTDYSFQAQLTVSGNYLYFVSRESQLWRTNGTTQGTQLVKAFAVDPQFGTKAPTGLMDAAGTLYFLSEQVSTKPTAAQQERCCYAHSATLAGLRGSITMG